MIQSKL